MTKLGDMRKIQFTTFLVAALLGIYGAKEIVTSLWAGASTRDGIQALAVGSLVFLAFLALTRVGSSGVGQRARRKP